MWLSDENNLLILWVSCFDDFSSTAQQVHLCIWHHVWSRSYIKIAEVFVWFPESKTLNCPYFSFETYLQTHNLHVQFHDSWMQHREARSRMLAIPF